MKLFYSFLCILVAILIAALPGVAQSPSINTGGIVLSSNGSTNLIYGQWWEIYGTNLSTCTQSAGAPSCSKVQVRYFTQWDYVFCIGGTCSGYVWQWLDGSDYTSKSTSQTWWYESPTQVNVLPSFGVQWQPCPGDAVSCEYLGTYSDSLQVCNSLGNCSASYDTGILPG